MEIQVNKLLKNHNVLPEIHSGFRTGYSWATALAEVTDSLLHSSVY